MTSRVLPLHSSGDGLLDVALVVGVHTGGSLVQNNNGGVFFKIAPGNRNTLTLAPGKAFTTFADQVSNPIRQCHDEIIAPGFFAASITSSRVASGRPMAMLL